VNHFETPRDNSLVHNTFTMPSIVTGAGDCRRKMHHSTTLWSCSSVLKYFSFLWIFSVDYHLRAHRAGYSHCTTRQQYNRDTRYTQSIPTCLPDSVFRSSYHRTKPGKTVLRPLRHLDGLQGTLMHTLASTAQSTSVSPTAAQSTSGMCTASHWPGYVSNVQRRSVTAQTWHCTR